MKIPVDVIKGVYKRFKEQFDQVDRSRDNFFSKHDFNTDEGDIFDTSVNKFDSEKIKQRSASFFKGFGIEQKPETDMKSAFKNTKINEL
jgi:hypothetical protein